MRTNANLPTLLLTYEQVGFLLPVLGHRSAPELDQNLTHLVSVGWRKQSIVPDVHKGRRQDMER